MLVEVLVQPKSGRFEVEAKDGKVKVFLKSAPEGNRANLELLKGMKKLLGREVSIVGGLKSRRKKLEIDITEAEWKDFLAGGMLFKR